MIIYALTDPRDSKVRYIGKTVKTAQRRLRRHLSSDGTSGNSYRARWLRVLVGLGLEPRIEVIERCDSIAELDRQEIFHIGRLRADGEQLTNSAPGGGSGGAPHTPESKAKIRAALTGKVRSASHRRRIGLASTGRKPSAEARAKMSQKAKRPRGRMSDSQVLDRARACGSRPIVDQHGNLYELQSYAAEKLGLSRAHINEVLHGKRRQVKGFIFRFAEVGDIAISA